MATSKHTMLDQDEFSRHSLYGAIDQSIHLYQQINHLAAEKMNVLDWGCGRGRDTLWLLDRGYNAYGVDVDPEPIRNGIPLYQHKGYGKDRLGIIDLSAKTKFANGFFHYTFSNQSFEHVKNLEESAVELFRVTRIGGAGYHVFPPRWGIREGHLFMPFIHWLPKRKVRWWWIRFWVGVGVEPKWEELKDKNPREKSDRYYEYANECTYYRPIKQIRRIFEDAGFMVNFVTWQDPKVQRNPLMRSLTRSKFFRSMINWFLINFVRVEIRLDK